MAKEIFALDIGTRKVMGIVARASDDEMLEIIDSEVIEHPSRPMLDGQIQNIEEVARTVRKIKTALEARLKKKLDTAGVAVAGRDLSTHKSKAAREFTVSEEITPQIVRDMELEAVDRIISDPQKNSSRFYCVGYSPVYYELDGNKISQLIGHRGRNISCEVIVTLLPRVVLESMFSVLKKSGLEPVNVTLEPIAAIHAIIPQELRRLNIVLVDIGAGTSDLAVTQDGYIFAYGMVPQAGDEITDHISEMLLTDFPSAERIKRSLGKNTRLEYEDIWGRKQEVDPNGLIEKLSPTIRKLAESIAENALILNGGIPRAVVVVGGGSLTHNLLPELARAFGLPPEKVGQRLPQAIKSIKNLIPSVCGPEAVTPLGITLMSLGSLGLRFIEISVNKKKFRMLDFRQKKDILGALALSDALSDKKLYPRPGLALSCYVNGELRMVKGTLGRPAKITLNGRPVSSLAQKISDGDALEFEEAGDGDNASSTIKELLDLKEAEIIFNREKLYLIPSLAMNGKEASPDTRISERADIRISPLKIKDALIAGGIRTENLSRRQIVVTINGSPKVLTQANFTLTLNGKTACLEDELKGADIIDFSQDSEYCYKIKDVVDIPQTSEKMHIAVGEKDIEIDIEPAQVFMNGHQVTAEEFLIDGADIKVYRLKEPQVMLSEIFRYIDFNPNNALGKKIKLLVNDAPAGFTTLLTEGSKVRILFEDREGPAE